jgi:hypothetical protein
MKELVKYVSSLGTVCGDKPTYSPAAKASSGTLRDEVDLELLKKLTHPQLVELYNKFLSWEPKPELASYHISFIQNKNNIISYIAYFVCKNVYLIRFQSP